LEGSHPHTLLAVAAAIFRKKRDARGRSGTSKDRVRHYAQHVTVAHVMRRLM
jgi:hypothetical protein